MAKRTGNFAEIIRRVKRNGDVQNTGAGGVPAGDDVSSAEEAVKIADAALTYSKVCAEIKADESGKKSTLTAGDVAEDMSKEDATKRGRLVYGAEPSLIATVDNWGSFAYNIFGHGLAVTGERISIPCDVRTPEQRLTSDEPIIASKKSVYSSYLITEKTDGKGSSSSKERPSKQFDLKECFFRVSGTVFISDVLRDLMDKHKPFPVDGFMLLNMGDVFIPNKKILEYLWTLKGNEEARTIATEMSNMLSTVPARNAVKELIEGVFAIKDAPDALFPDNINEDDLKFIMENADAVRNDLISVVTYLGRSGNGLPSGTFNCDWDLFNRLIAFMDSATDSALNDDSDDEDYVQSDDDDDSDDE